MIERSDLEEDDPFLFRLSLLAALVECAVYSTRSFVRVRPYKYRHLVGWLRIQKWYFADLRGDLLFIPEEDENPEFVRVLQLVDGNTRSTK